ncbi:hypothetical protein MHZ92_07095 [Sporosarcina sp. ACRSL]|uniref:hypothetical protein n=1 Tax=Sporosarcina sp. ACRSL TaxID=2918215 RepID=UPI001EF7037D|nr:hypothetical protein [Sporosarcina sp. ACRSL]MCG7343892.1 hypothetical protein [Sporosarcina sp. ACRSL]
MHKTDALHGPNMSTAYAADGYKPYSKSITNSSGVRNYLISNITVDFRSNNVIFDGKRKDVLATLCFCSQTSFFVTAFATILFDGV